jgi:hypothetical protein
MRLAVLAIAFVLSGCFQPPQTTEKMTDEEKTALMVEIAKCWHPPKGAAKEKWPTAIIEVAMDWDGTLISARPKEIGRYAKEKNYQLLADSGIKALKKCAPFDSLPKNKYDQWKSMEISFDPMEMKYPGKKK